MPGTLILPSLIASAVGSGGPWSRVIFDTFLPSFSCGPLVQRTVRMRPCTSQDPPTSSPPWKVDPRNTTWLSRFSSVSKASFSSIGQFTWIAFGSSRCRRQDLLNTNSSRIRLDSDARDGSLQLIKSHSSSFTQKRSEALLLTLPIVPFVKVLLHCSEDGCADPLAATDSCFLLAFPSRHRNQHLSGARGGYL